MAEEREDYVEMILNARKSHVTRNQPASNTIAQLSSSASGVNHEKLTGRSQQEPEPQASQDAGSEKDRHLEEDMSEKLGELTQHKKLYMLDDRSILYIVTARVVERNILHLRKSTAIEKDVKVRRLKELRNDHSFEIDFWILELDFVFSKAANTEYIIIPKDRNHRLTPETARSLVKDNLFEIDSSKEPVGPHAKKYIPIKEVGIGLDQPATDSRLIVHIVDEQQTDQHLIDHQVIEESEEANPRAVDFKVQPVLSDKQQTAIVEPSNRSRHSRQASQQQRATPQSIFTGYALLDSSLTSKPSYTQQLLIIENRAAVTLQRYFRYKQSGIGRSTYSSLQSVKQYLNSMSKFSKFLLFYSLLPSRVAVDSAIDLFTQK